jgi:4-carboxymuconolactone decarboxylase
MDDAERARQGMTVRRAVLGDEHVDRAVATTTPFTAPFQDFITRYAWGEIWSRPGLSRPERSIVTLAVLAALQHENELAMHVKAAVRNGLSTQQIQEVLLQVAVYAGVPAANRAFAVAQRALTEAAPAAPPPRSPHPLLPPHPSPPPGRTRSETAVSCHIAPRGFGSLFPGIGSLAAELASGHSPSSDRRTSVLMASAEAVSFC